MRKDQDLSIFKFDDYIKNEFEKEAKKNDGINLEDDSWKYEFLEKKIKNKAINYLQ